MLPTLRQFLKSWLTNNKRTTILTSKSLSNYSNSGDLWRITESPETLEIEESYRRTVGNGDGLSPALLFGLRPDVVDTSVGLGGGGPSSHRAGERRSEAGSAVGMGVCDDDYFLRFQVSPTPVWHYAGVWCGHNSSGTRIFTADV